MKSNASILIENYELTGCHGVNPEEKTEAQRFLFSAVLDIDATAAANSDDVDKTVSYSAVCKLIKVFFCENSRNLLETLALGAAEFSENAASAQTVAQGGAVGHVFEIEPYLFQQ